MDIAEALIEDGTVEEDEDGNILLNLADPDDEDDEDDDDDADFGRMPG